MLPPRPPPPPAAVAAGTGVPDVDTGAGAGVESVERRNLASEITSSARDRAVFKISVLAVKDEFNAVREDISA